MVNGKKPQRSRNLKGRCERDGGMDQVKGWTER